MLAASLLLCWNRAIVPPLFTEQPETQKNAPPKEPGKAASMLPTRQRALLKLQAQGLHVWKIAERLNVQRDIVRYHLRNIQRKGGGREEVRSESVR